MGLPRTRKMIIAIVFMAVVLAVVGGYNLSQEASVTEVSDNNLTIVTSFYPVYIMALNITQDIQGLELINLAPSDIGCIHDIQLSTKDLKVLEESDIFIINGLGMESYLDKVIENNPQLKLLNSTEKLDSSLFKPDHDNYQAEHENAGHYHDHDHDHEINPHTWVSIELAIQQIRTIGEQLGLLDPANKSLYTENTENYVAKLEKQKVRIEQGLAELENKNIITFHQSFKYFAEEFGLNILAVVQGEHGSEPSARELAETIELVKRNQVKAIFIEPQFPDSTAQAIALETDAKVYSLDPAASGDLTPDAYLRAMEKNLLVLQEALK